MPSPNVANAQPEEAPGLDVDDLHDIVNQWAQGGDTDDEAKEKLVKALRDILKDKVAFQGDTTEVKTALKLMDVVRELAAGSRSEAAEKLAEVGGYDKEFKFFSKVYEVAKGIIAGAANGTEMVERAADMTVKAVNPKVLLEVAQATIRVLRAAFPSLDADEETKKIEDAVLGGAIKGFGLGSVVLGVVGGLIAGPAGAAMGVAIGGALGGGAGAANGCVTIMGEQRKAEEAAQAAARKSHAVVEAATAAEERAA